MEQFDKNMQDKFQDLDSNIPSEFSWDALGDGIMANVEVKKRSKKILWFLIPSLLVIAGFIGYNLAKYENKLATKNIDQSEEQAIDLIDAEQEISKNRIETLDNNNNTSNTNTNNKKQSTNLTISKDINSTTIEEVLDSRKSPSTADRNSKANQSAPANSVSTSADLAAMETTLKASPDSENINRERNSSTNVFDRNVESSVDKNTQGRNTSGVDVAQNTRSSSENNFGRKPLVPTGQLSIKLNKLTFSSAPIENTITTLDKNDISQDEKVDVLPNIKHTISLNNQLSMWNFTASDFDLSTYESTLPAWNINLGYGYALIKRLSINSGVGYNLNVSKLDYIFTQETHEYRPDVPQTIINHYTGETRQEMGAFAEVTSKRHVIHHNKMHTLSIPLSVNYNYFIKNNIILGVDVGVRGNFIFSREGRGINANLELVEYKDLARTTMLFAQAQVGTYAEYSLNQKINLRLGIQYNPHVTKVEWLADDSRGISDGGINFGIRYDLD